MLLSVADTPEDLEHIRKMFTHHLCFTYLALKENMLALARKYEPKVILLRVKEMTETLVRDAKRLYEEYPDLKFVIASDDTSHTLPCAIQVKYHTCALHLVFHTCYYKPPSAASGKMKENHRIDGLYFNTYFSEIRIFGFASHRLTDNDGTLLRFLAEHYPAHVSAEKIAECCFGYGKTVTIDAVKKRIRRINQHAKAWFNDHDIIKHFDGESFQIDF